MWLYTKKECICIRVHVIVYTHHYVHNWTCTHTNIYLHEYIYTYYTHAQEESLIGEEERVHIHMFARALYTCMNMRTSEYVRAWICLHILHTRAGGSADRRGLQCVAVCCSVLQCVAVCCSVLNIYLHECIYTYYTHAQEELLIGEDEGMIKPVVGLRVRLSRACQGQGVKGPTSLYVQCVALCCRVLRCAAVCCVVLQCVALRTCQGQGVNGPYCLFV